jgi:phosphoglycolate phosphatase (TIGR01487 family)
MVPPLVADIDGTLTRPDKSIDLRVLDPIRTWEAPVVIATGKAFPYPVALCEFLGIEIAVIAENGGVVFLEAADEVAYNGDPEGAAAVAAEYREAGHELGWGAVDPVNRWRETEVAVSRDQPLEPLVEIAERHGLAVVDTGYAYHVKSPAVDKGRGLEAVAGLLGHEPSEFAAVGDSENDAELFERAGRSFAVANADGAARAAADTVTDGSFADGFLEALERLHPSA